MNRLLFEKSEIQNGELTLGPGHRFEHVTQVLKVTPGQLLRVGEMGGLCGHAKVLGADPNQVRMRVELTEPPPQPLPLKLVLALPRPKALGRILESVTELGVKEIYLIHAAKVEKSYWQAHQLRPDEIQRHLMMGLSLSGDTILPMVHLAPQFRPFTEDILPPISANTARWVADPRGTQHLFSNTAPKQPATLCIGPEGGWNDFELELLKAQGFQIGRFGSRVLSTETATPAMLAAFADKQNEV